MNINVTATKVSIDNESLNKGEYNVRECNFNLAEEYEGLVCKALFTTSKTKLTYEQSIVNGKCNIPYEATVNRGKVIVGVIGYEIEDEELIKRYSPEPDEFFVLDGSYVEDIENQSTPTPSELEQLEQRVSQVEIDAEDISEIKTDFNTLENTVIGQAQEIAENISDIVVLKGKVGTNETDISSIKQEQTTQNTNITNLQNNKANASDVYTTSAVDGLLNDKVDKQAGKGLSTNDYDNTEKAQVETNRTNILLRSLITETGNKISLEINNTTFVLTAKLYDKNNNLIHTSNGIDLPLETMVVNASYNNTTKKIVLTLQNGTTVDFSVADLVSDLVSETTFNTALANKVDKVAGKGLSTNDFTDEYKDQVDTNTEDISDLQEEQTTQNNEITALQEENVELDERLEFLENLSENAELTWKQIQTIVQAGKASKYFKVGDQIETTWKNTATNTTYDVPLDVVSLEDVIIDDDGVEKTVPGMILQWHYCTPFGVQFSQNQAFYYCAETLPAGTYYITIGSNWGSNCHSGYMYEFTTTQDVPAGGQILLGKTSSEVGALPDSAPSTWRVRTYSSASSTTPLEILTLTEYTSGTPSGTSLGTLSSNTKYNTTLNNLYSSAYGHNRWKNSAVRQFLNSNENAENWFNMPSDDVFARKPDQLSSKNGFLTGVDSELLAVIKPTKVATAINTNRDSEIGTWDYTYDKFFIPSLEQIYCVPQISGEGAYWNYWKTKSGKTSPNAQYSKNANMITYAVENHSSAQYVRLRSAYRSHSYYTWIVNSSGYIDGYYYATYAYRFSPACVIC